MSGCSDSSHDPGSGIVTYLGPKERDIVSENRQEYFLIASINRSGNADEKFTIFFRIPDAAQPGNFNLVTPDPLKVGENFDVRVETLEEGRLIAYYINTEGTIILDNFSPDRTYPSISNITGTFQFFTENSDGAQISANGTFDFPLGKEIVSERTINSFRNVS